MGNTDTPTVEETSTTEPSDFTPITSQSDLDKIISARLVRERKKYEDYEEVKGQAARVPNLESVTSFRANTAQRIPLAWESLPLAWV